MRAINLLPPGERATSGLSISPGRLAGLGAAVLVLGLGWMGWSAKSEVSKVGEQIAAEETTQQNLQIELAPLRQSAARIADVSRVEAEVVLLAAGRTDWEKLVRRISTVLPKQVWLTTLRGEATPQAAPPAAGTETPGSTVQAPTGGLHIEGMALTHQQVAMTLARIAAIPGVGEPRLSASERDAQASGRSLVRFTIDASVDTRALSLDLSELSTATTTGGPGQ